MAHSELGSVGGCPNHRGTGLVPDRREEQAPTGSASGHWSNLARASREADDSGTRMFGPQRQTTVGAADRWPLGFAAMASARGRRPSATGSWDNPAAWLRPPLRG